MLPLDSTDDCLDKTPSAEPQEGKLRLAPLFQPEGVLQYGKILPVWGWTAPSVPVDGTLNGASAHTVSGADGSFCLRFPPQAPAGPVKLTVSAAGSTVTVEPLWIGEVYLLSGQSNAEFTLGGLTAYPQLLAAGKLHAPQVRYFKVPFSALPSRSAECGGSWLIPQGDNIKNCSALGYRFAATLSERMSMKVGIVESSLGGSSIGSWISIEALANEGPYRDDVPKYLLNKSNPKYYAKLPPDSNLPDSMDLVNDMLDQLKAFPPDDPETTLWAQSDFDDSAWDAAEFPGSWTELGHSHPGVFWFRRELDLPEGAENGTLTLHLGAIDKGDITYFNGVEIGRTGDGRDMQYWNAQRNYEVPRELIKRHNVIAVRAASVFSIATDGGLIGPTAAMQAEGAFGTVPLSGVWRYKMEQDLSNPAATCQQLLGPGFGSTLGTLFDNMIYPLLPYALAGVLWYQGEFHTLAESRIYRELLTLLVRDWRYRFIDRKLNFVIIQLPKWQAPRRFSAFSHWAELREAQAQAASELDLDLVVTTDTGDEIDLHPQDKFVVADRAAEIALSRREGHPIRPVQVSSARCIGGKIVLTLSEPIRLTGMANGFAVVGADQAVHYPDFALDDGKIVLTLAGQPLPLAGTVYYNWSTGPVGDLHAPNGQPLPPFRIALAD